MIASAIQSAQTPFGDISPTAGIMVVAFYGSLLAAGLFMNIWLLFHMPWRSDVWTRFFNRLRWRPWSLIDLLWLGLFIIGAHLTVIVGVSVMNLLGWYDLARAPFLPLILHSVALHWMALFFVLGRMQQRRMSWGVAFGGIKTGWARDTVLGVGAYLATLPILVFYVLLYQIWLKSAGYEVQPQDVVRIFAELESRAMMAYMIVLAVIIAPVTEELVFRGLLLPALARRIGMGLAIFVSSVLFAGMHLHIPSLAPLFVFSIALSLAYAYTESIRVPIIMHALFNGVSIAVMVLMQQ